jgi:hypothetical protein
MNVAMGFAAASLCVLVAPTVLAGSANDAPLLVVDANGKVVGRYAGTRAAPEMIMTLPQGRASVALQSTTGGLTWGLNVPQNFSVGFTQRSCEGRAYIEAVSYPFDGTLPTFLFAPHSTFEPVLYVARSMTPVVESGTILSKWVIQQFCTDVDQPISDLAFPVVAIELAPLFTPPFTIR